MTPTAKTKYSLQELVSKIKPQDHHPETNWSRKKSPNRARKKQVLLNATPSPFPLPHDIDDPADADLNASK